MATLRDFTTPDEVRAVLGVAPEELEDSTIASPVYVKQLQFRLGDIDSGIEPLYVTSATKSSRSTAEQKYVDAIQTFAAYYISKLLMPSLSLFAPQTITDGKSEVDRVDTAYQDIKEGIIAGCSLFEDRIRTAYFNLGVIIYNPPKLWDLTVTASTPFDPTTGV